MQGARQPPGASGSSDCRRAEGPYKPLPQLPRSSPAGLLDDDPGADASALIFPQTPSSAQANGCHRAGRRRRPGLRPRSKRSRHCCPAQSCVQTPKGNVRRPRESPRRNVDPGTRSLHAQPRSWNGKSKLNRVARTTQTAASSGCFPSPLLARQLSQPRRQHLLDQRGTRVLGHFVAKAPCSCGAGLLLSSLQRSRFRAWSVLKRPQRAPPLPAQMLAAMAGIAFPTGCCRLTTCLLADFDGFLRCVRTRSLTAAQMSCWSIERSHL